MDVLITKYNLVQGSQKQFEQLYKDIQKQHNNFVKSTDLAGLKNALLVLESKICVPNNYAEPYGTGADMRRLIVEEIDSVMAALVSSGRVRIQDCNELVLNFMLNCMQAGPDQVHVELMRKALAMRGINMMGYMQNLRGADLNNLVERLKEYRFNTGYNEGYLEKKASDWYDAMSCFVSCIARVETGSDPEIKRELVNLHMHLLDEQGTLPEKFCEYVNYVNRDIERVLPSSLLHNTDKDQDLQRGQTDPKDIRMQISKVMKLVDSSGSGENTEQVHWTCRTIVEMVESVRKDFRLFTELWDDFHQLLRCLVAHKGIKGLDAAIKKFSDFYEIITGDVLKKDKKWMEKWSRDFSKTVAEGETETVAWLVIAVVHYFKKKTGITPVKGDEIYWLPVIKAMLKHPVRDVLAMVRDTLRNEHFRRIWNWKKNWKEALELIHIIGEPKHPNPSETAYTMYGVIVYALIEQFELIKMEDRLAYGATELYISSLESEAENINKMPPEYMKYLPALVNDKEKIADFVRRFEPVLYDTTFDWCGYSNTHSGYNFIKTVLKSYKDGTEIDDKVNQSLISMFRFSLAGDVEYMDLGTQRPTVFQLILQESLRPFIMLHAKKMESRDVVRPLIPLLMDMLDFDVDILRQTAEYTVRELASTEIGVQLLKNNVEDLVNWYGRSQSENAVWTLAFMFSKLNKGDLDGDYQPLFAACLENRDTQHNQIMVFSELAKALPEAFTEENITSFLKNYFSDPNITLNVLMMLDAIAQQYPQRFPFELTMQRLYKDLQFDEKHVHFTSRISTGLAMVNESNADKVLVEIMELSKKQMQPMSTAILMMCPMTIAWKYGIGKLKPYKDYFNTLKNSSSMDIERLASGAIDAMEGKNVDGIMEQLKQNTKDIAILDLRLTKTEKDVAGVQKQVVKNTKDVARVRAGLHGVNERVDQVQEDLDEAKAIVKDMANKIMKNAPVWMQDVTKLMNPKSEHDWRLLARRLGYANRDTRPGLHSLTLVWLFLVNGSPQIKQQTQHMLCWSYYRR